MLALLGILVLAEVPLPDGGQSLAIDRASIDARGVLALECTFSFPTSQRIYSWRRSLQPALDRIHSPARSGLKVGHRYTIEATWHGHEYHVDEPVLMKEEPAKIKPRRANQKPA